MKDEQSYKAKVESLQMQNEQISHRCKFPPVEVLSAEDVAIPATQSWIHTKSASNDNEHWKEDEPEEALVVEEVAAGVAPHALRVPLLVQHC